LVVDLYVVVSYVEKSITLHNHIFKIIILY